MSGRELSAKLPDRSSQHGMYEIGQYLLQRGEHEIAPLEKRVRNREPLAADDPVFVEQHVDVHRPRAVARIRRSHPSQYPLDTLAFVEYPLGRQWGFDREHLVQESFVGLESPWFRLSERRAENDPSHRFGEQPFRFGEILGDRTEVRARYQHHARHYSRFISLLTVSAKWGKTILGLPFWAICRIVRSISATSGSMLRLFT